MNFGLWQGIYTIVSLVAFIYIVAWAFSGKRTKDFEAAARLPLEDDESRPPPR